MPGANASISYFTMRFISSTFYFMNLRVSHCVSVRYGLSQDFLASRCRSVDIALEGLTDISQGDHRVKNAFAEVLGPSCLLGMSLRMTRAVDALGGKMTRRQMRWRRWVLLCYEGRGIDHPDIFFIPGLLVFDARSSGMAFISCWRRRWTS